MLTAKQLNSTVQYALEEEIDYLKELSAQMDHPNIVMIGAGPGILGLAVTENNFGVRLSIVDIDPNPLHYTQVHLLAAGVSPKNIRLITGDSAQAGHMWEDGPIDLLIVDGNHTQEGVARDITAWFEHVSDGGYMFFHDHLEREGGFNGSGSWGLAGVAEAVNAAASADPESWQYVTSVGISVVYRKLLSV
jgi:predicted O-methyltransferase YrrM